jgi:hypothetical protein
MKTELGQYKIGEQFACFLAYGDESGLEEQDLVDFVGFENGINQYDKPQGFRFGHWDITEQTEEFALCQVTETEGKCIIVNAVWIME